MHPCSALQESGSRSLGSSAEGSQTICLDGQLQHVCSSDQPLRGGGLACVCVFVCICLCVCVSVFVCSCCCCCCWVWCYSACACARGPAALIASAAVSTPPLSVALCSSFSHVPPCPPWSSRPSCNLSCFLLNPSSLSTKSGRELCYCSVCPWWLYAVTTCSLLH